MLEIFLRLATVAILLAILYGICMVTSAGTATLVFVGVLAFLMLGCWLLSRASE